MKEFDFDKTWIGIVIGLLTPVIVYTIYYFLIYKTGVKTVNISICIAANLIPFYFYQKGEHNNGLKGVLISTILWAVVIAFISLFTPHLNIG